MSGEVFGGLGRWVVEADSDELLEECPYCEEGDACAWCDGTGYVPHDCEGGVEHEPDYEAMAEREKPAAVEHLETYGIGWPE